MTLSEMRELIARHELRLTKSLGQNFLHDGNQLRKIIRAAELEAAGPVLEIGPGLGPLTELLLAAGCLVTAIEMDQFLLAILRERFAGVTRLNLIHGDALTILRDYPHDWTPFKLVANLPYSVGSPLLVDMALRPSVPSLIVVTLQLEVAQRLMAREGTDAYGLLTLLIGLRYQTEQSFKIPASCFFPPPDVDSACIRLRRRTSPLVPAGLQSRYVELVKLAFSQRRKMMWKLLRTRWPEDSLARAFHEAKVRRDARAETVGPSQFAILTHELENPGPAAVEPGNPTPSV